MSDGIRVLIAEPSWFYEAYERRDWMLVFTYGSSHLVDEVNQMLKHYPTYPSVIGPGLLVTVVPRAEQTTRKMHSVVKRLQKKLDMRLIGQFTPNIHIFFFGADDEDQRSVLDRFVSMVAAGKAEGGGI